MMDWTVIPNAHSSIVCFISIWTCNFVAFLSRGGDLPVVQCLTCGYLLSNTPPPPQYSSSPVSSLSTCDDSGDPFLPWDPGHIMK